MNVLFLTIARLPEINVRDDYAALIRMFRDNGHNTYMVSPRERRYKQPTEIVVQDNVTRLFVKTLNIQKTNLIEKGLGTVLIEYQFKRALKKYLGDTSFDLIIYSTPPITFPKVIEFLRKKNKNAVTYLLLKDIFPQNAVDLEMFSKRSLLYKFFRKKELKLYSLTDYIGCMSPANVEYLVRHNPTVDAKNVEIAPNAVELEGIEIDKESQESKEILAKYQLPLDKPIFIYGGNLGKPQGVPYLLKCLEANKNREDCHFLIVGSGTEYGRLEEWVKNANAKSVTLIPGLPKEDYDKLVKACHVGLIFLDHRFTIPNYPSRLISYLEYKMPVISATDPNSDVGPISEKNGYGLWCESNDVDAFTDCVDKMLKADIKGMGEKGYEYLKKNYLIENLYNPIIQRLNKN